MPPPLPQAQAAVAPSPHPSAAMDPSSNQPLAPLAPTTYSTTSRPTSSGMRSPPGQAPLHIQTQQPTSSPPLPAAAGAAAAASPAAASPAARPVAADLRSPSPAGPLSPASGASGQAAPGQRVASPQSATYIPPSAATASSVYSAQPGFARGVASPASDRRMSPTPQGSSPVPSRFPPRKSSMGQSDMPDLADVNQPRSGSRPGSSHRPWMEARPASPQGPRSPGTPSKPLPFIRPSEIYKRMEEEKEKERRSMESSRHSMESVGSRGIERTDSPLKPEAEKAPEPHRASLGRDEPADAQRNSRPALATVAERKSEYGLEGLISDPPLHEEEPKLPESRPEPAISQMPPAVVPAQGGEQHQKPSQTLSEHEEARRFSTSPTLPSLARMSAFGDDLFSNPSSFLSDAPPLPAIPDQPSPPEPEKQAEPMLPRIPSPAAQPPRVTSPAISVHDSSPASSAPKAAEPLVERPAETSSLRPHLPGQWVSETASTPGEQAPQTPAAHVAGGGFMAAGNLSPLSETDDGGNSVKTPMADPQAAVSEKAVEVATLASKDADLRARSRSPAQSPRDLPPLRTQSRSPQPAEAHKAAGTPTKPHEGLGKTESPGPTPATAVSEIPPIAPLNPMRGSEPPEFVAPQHLDRISTMSTMTDSPLKESDKLREEIIKTLSPVSGPEENMGGIGGESSKPLPAGRESTYLHDVYDDYWADDDKDEAEVGEGSTEERPHERAILPQPTIPEEQEEEAAAAAPAPAIQVETQVPEAPAVNPRSPLREVATSSPGGLHRNRFSWEIEHEPVVVTTAPAHPAPGIGGGVLPDPEPKSLSIDPPARQPTPTPANSAAPSPAVSGGHLSPTTSAAQQQLGSQLKQDTEPTTTMSHQVSQASTLPPRAAAALPEPPSPVSVLSDKNLPQDTSRLSLADEKALALDSSNLVSPTPPPEQHPALARSGLTPPPGATPISPGPGPGPTSPASQNIMSFRQCMSYNTVGERIERLQETRSQFAASDSGLASWVAFMSAQPEHANSTGSFRDNIAFGQARSPTGQMASPTGGSPAVAQQPYYQQYLNASATNLQGQAGQRPPAGMGSSSQFGPSSDFRHSGGQVGTKSKELLMAAGKASKGLFSKGKNKLRGTGDKVFF